MLKLLYEILPAEARWRVLWTTLMLIILGLVEVIGVTSVLPFMALAANPELATRQPVLHQVYLGLGLQEPRQLVVIAGVGVLLVLAGCNLWSAVTSWLSLKLMAWLQQDLCCRLLGNYLAREYVWFLNRNISRLAQTVLLEVTIVVVSCLFALMRLISRLVVIACILVGLIYLNPWVALLTACLLSSAYGLIFLNLRARLGAIGKQRIRAEEMRHKLTWESLSSVKTNIVLQRDQFFLRRFERHCKEAFHLTAIQAGLAEIPRYLLEFIAFGSVIGMILLIFYQNGDLRSAIPAVSVFTFASYRLLPALQQSFAYATSIRTNQVSLDHLHTELCRGREDLRPADAADSVLPFNHRMHIKTVTFKYPGAAKPVLNGIELEIEKNKTVAFVGSTGAGKTTLVDIILGLLNPDGGCVSIDEQALDVSNLRSWQKNLGYVPQDIYLMDDSISSNIAYGIAPEDIDHEAVVKASRIASLHDFITTLPLGYETEVGDRGVRLSGGQRQRIGIARALYHDPGVLILDEATSSLDGLTEAAVMEAVGKLANKKTIILIAHRLATVREADRIFFLENGLVSDQGTFSELTERNSAFRAMAAHNDETGKSE